MRLSEQAPKSVVLLATKQYHCLGELLLRHAFSGLNATMAAVVSNHEVLGPLVRQFGLPFHYPPHTGRACPTHEAEVLAAIGACAPIFVLLAKYMRILSAEFVAQYAGRLINIHHSFLPAFVRASSYAQAYARGVKLMGATAHFVTNELDEEPISA